MLNRFTNTSIALLRHTTCVLCFLCACFAVHAADSLQLAVVDLYACEATGGADGAFFNLDAHGALLADGQTGVTFSWFEDEMLTQAITETNNYNSTDRRVWVVGSISNPDCQDTISIQLFVEQAPDLSYLLGIEDTICGSLTGFAFAVPNGPEATYSWSPAERFVDPTVANPVFVPITDETVYTLTVEATSMNAECMTMTTVEFLYLEAELTIDTDDTIFYCKTDDVLMEVTLMATTSGDAADIQWTASRDTLSATSGAMTSITPEFNTTIYATQTFPNGCVITDSVLIQVDSLPEFDLERPEDLSQPCMKYCPGEIVTLIANAIDVACYPDIEFEWLPNSVEGGDQVEDTTANAILILSNANTQNYIRVTTNNACIERDTNLVEVVDTMPMLLGLPDRVCRGDQFRIEIDPDYLNNGSFTEIRWSIGDGGTLDCGDCEGRTNVLVTIDDLASGSVGLQVKGIKEECCTATGSLSIPIVVPELSLAPTVFCPEEEKVITATPSNHTDYQWMATGVDLTAMGNMATLNTTVEGDYQVIVRAVDPTGCPSEGIRLVRVTPAEMTLSFEPPLLDAAVGDLITVTGQLNPPAAQPIVWTVDGQQVTTGDTYEFTLEFGEFELCATGESANGCVGTTCIIIERLFDIFIPNVFAPSDNMNELNQSFRPFTPSAAGANSPLAAEFIVDFLVYNRWGQLVYDNDSNDTGWDGTQDGEDAPSDVYLYKMELRNADGESRSFHGDVTLLR